jgi:hypothetical protein
VAREQSRALAFAGLLASQPMLLLSMRSPDRPWWTSRRPWTKTLTVVVTCIGAATFAVVYVSPLAHLLHLDPFPAPGWAVVIGVACTAICSEPFKRGGSHDRS